MTKFTKNDVPEPATKVRVPPKLAQAMSYLDNLRVGALVSADVVEIAVGVSLGYLRDHANNPTIKLYKEMEGNRMWYGGRETIKQWRVKQDGNNLN